MSGLILDIPTRWVAGTTTKEKATNAARLHDHFAKWYGVLEDADPPGISYPEPTAPADALRRTLEAAYHQAMHGKGRARHGGGKPFEEQPIFTIAELLDGSIDGHLFQVIKKAQEASRMVKAGQHEAARRELMGVIIYAAAAHMILEKRDA